MPISDPPHWKEVYGDDKGDKYNKILAMIAQINANEGGAPGAHKATHQDGGGDEISVAGLAGLLAAAQTPLSHETSHRSGGGDALTDVAFLAGIQTINGVKTFGSIPVLPASDPTLDNQAARKLYSDKHSLVGAANAAWQGCFTFSVNPDWSDSRGTGITLANQGANNMVVEFMLPQPTNRGGKKLYISGVRVGLYDADGTNYIDHHNLFGTTGTTYLGVWADNADYTSPQLIENLFTAIDCSSYELMFVTVYCINADVYAIDLMTITCLCYYA